MSDASAPTPADALITAALRGMERATAAVSGALAELRADKTGPGQVHVQRLVCTVGPERLDELLSFNATAVLVDNYSDQHVFIQPAQTWAVPFARGQVFPLAGTHRAFSIIEATPGRADPAKTSGETVVLTWMERFVPIGVIRDL